MSKYVIGIDEAGRGPLAGPVTIGLFAVEEKFLKDIKKEFFNKGIRDSKKMTLKKREEIFNSLSLLHKEGKIEIGHCHISASYIDQLGISKCLIKGVKKVLSPFAVNGDKVEVKLDGLLKAPSVFTCQETIVKGDEKEIVIALASVVAKVTRDKVMIEESIKYPVYKFETHKGYGTKIHREAILKYGSCDIHRQSFLTKILNKNN